MVTLGGGVIVILTLRIEHEAGFTGYRVTLDRHVLRGVVLELGVTATAGVVINVPIVGVELRGIEVILPNKGVLRLLLRAGEEDKREYGEYYLFHLSTDFTDLHGIYSIGTNLTNNFALQVVEGVTSTDEEPTILDKLGGYRLAAIHAVDG